jgi:hypothetical protein
METVSTTSHRPPVFRQLMRQFQNWLGARSALSELDRTSPAETARIAHDLGLSSSDLVRLADRGPNAADLLSNRLEALHIDADKLVHEQPAALRDMQRLCAMCEAKGRCARDLAERPDDASWRQYCPNVETVDAVSSR